MEALIGNGFVQSIYDQINIRQKYLGLTKPTTLSSFNNATSNVNLEISMPKIILFISDLLY